jgi:hypothetical protein
MDIRRPILYKSARRCGRIPIHVQAQEHERGICELWLSGEKTAAPLSLQDFRPVLLPRDVASPSPCAYFPHFYRALLIFTLPFCWVFDSRSRCTLPVNLGLCRFRKKKKTLASASRTAKQRLGAVRENSGANGAREAETQRPRLVHPLDAVARFFFVATYCISFPRW